jgi:hypothetical protein
LLNGARYRGLGDGVEFGRKPVFEAREVFVTFGQQGVVFEQAAKMRYVSAAPGGVEALMAQWDIAAGKSFQQGLHFGGAFPGEDAFGSVNAAQDLDDGFHGVRIRGTLDHQGGQVLT